MLQKVMITWTFHHGHFHGQYVHEHREHREHGHSHGQTVHAFLYNGIRVSS